MKVDLHNISVADPDPGSGIGYLFDPWIRDPGFGMGESQHQDPGYGMNNPDHIFYSLETIYFVFLCVKILRGSGIRDGNSSNP